MSLPSANVEVSALVKRFRGVEVLRGVDLTFESGRVSALLGPSGSGKSTLLRCMMGLEEFDAGSVRVGDVTLAAGPARKHAQERRALQQRAGLVFQQWHLFPHRSALENVMEAPVHVRRVPVAEARQKARELLAQVGLAERMDAMPRDLSGGEQQRCAIARALAMEPRVLFLDEPTSALDPQRAVALSELLRGLVASRGLTLVCVTHDIAFAERVAQDLVVLHAGEVVERGEAAAVINAPKDSRTRELLARG
ncbi:MAG: amino acid ABC transporter ATP-binding protein [Myxococcales bacterium]|nr:amino acid ABC transporter ATP-binding protein [Myxococcales bacterium]MCB9628591.1 amino acid ABC transporter ATP-binding protein [Sandaracinaceae bacterium]